MNKTSALLFSLLAATVAGCDEDPPPAGCTLPAEPQLSPNSPDGVIGFELIRQGESSTLDAVFVNGGCNDLEIDLASITITPAEGVPGDAFEIGDVFPATGIVASRQAIGIPITFTSPDPPPPGADSSRGIYFATLSFTSNADNLPSYALEVVAPSAGGTIPSWPDIEFFEASVDIEPSAAIAAPTALVRFYNLGGATLSVSDYSLDNTDDFKLLDGTATPTASCVYGKACRPDDGLAEGCCEGGLACRCLGFEDDGQTCRSVVGKYGEEIDCGSNAAACDPYGWLCDTNTNRCTGTTPPPCFGGAAECAPFAPLTCTENQCGCTVDSDCGDDRECEDGVCTVLAQICATVNVTSGQFSILGVQLTDSAEAGDEHTTTLSVTSNDTDEPVATVEITGTK